MLKHSQTEIYQLQFKDLRKYLHHIITNHPDQKIPRAELLIDQANNSDLPNYRKLEVIKIINTTLDLNKNPVKESEKKHTL